MKKKNVVTTALAVGLAAVLALGGTFAYYQDSSEKVTNTVKPNYNSVSLKESDVDGDGSETGNTYEIVPGTTDTKDPVATVNYTLDSYVYLVVDETASDLIDFAIDTSVWTQLDGYPNVWYTLVTAADADDSFAAAGNETVTVYTKDLNVLTDKEISYASSITNEDMFVTDAGEVETDANGNPVLIDSLTLNFQAYIIQATLADYADDNDGDRDGVEDNYATPEEAFLLTYYAAAVEEGNVAAIGMNVYGTLQEALAAVADSETVTLLANIEATEAVTYNEASKSVTLDLNGNTITNSGTESYVLLVSDGTLTIADSTGTGAISGAASSQVGVQMTGGTLNVASGTVSGSAGILTAGGTLNVSGGAVTGLSESYATISRTYDGGTVDAYKDTVDSLTAVNGSGIFIVAGSDSDLTVNISGGTISTANYEDNHDICVVKLTGGTELGVTINVTGGTFGGDSGDFDNCYLAYDWDNDQEYSWITLNTGNCEFSSTAGKYKISGGTGLAAGWIGVSGTSLY